MVKILIIAPIDMNGVITGKEIVSIDSVGAGIGDQFLSLKEVYLCMLLVKAIPHRLSHSCYNWYYRQVIRWWKDERGHQFNESIYKKKWLWRNRIIWWEQNIKNSIKVDTYGNIDESVAFIGAARALVKDKEIKIYSIRYRRNFL